MPVWSAGALVAIEKSPSTEPLIHVFNASGVEEKTIPVKITGANVTFVYAAAHGANGAIAITGAAQDAQGQVGDYLTVVSPTNEITILRTNPYVPSSVVIAPDTTIWTKGIELRKGMRARDIPAGIIRHFDASGKFIESFILQSSLNGGDIGNGHGNLAASAARIGWYSGGHHYFEISPGGEVQQYPGVSLAPGEGVSALALADSGDVFVSSTRPGKPDELYRLDRNLRVWTPVELGGGVTPANTKMLLGGEGSTLVFMTFDYHVFRFFKVD
jgi:hypothetical protein